MFDRGISLAGRHVETFGEQLEMVDQLFHVGLHGFARRCGDLVVVGDDRAGIGAQPLHALHDDAVGLAHLGHAHQVAVVAVAGLANRNVEIHLAVSVVGLFFAQVPGNARAAQHRAREPQVEGPLGCHHADTHGALFPDAVVGQQGFVFVHLTRKILAEVGHEIEQAALPVLVELGNRARILDLAGLVLRHRVGQVAVHPTGADVGCMHTCARHRLVHVEQGLALAKAVDQDVHRAAVETMRAQPHQVVEQPRDLGEHHADVLRPQRHVDLQQLFNCQAISLLVGHHRHVVEPVHIR